MVSKQPFVARSGSDLLKPILPSGAMALKPSYGKNAYFIPIPTLDSHLVGLRFLLSIPVTLVIMVRISLR